jgi:hypothetical protein
MTRWPRDLIRSWLLFPFLVAPLPAQTGVDLTDSVRVEIRTLLQDLRSAAAQHAWDQVEPHFPTESEWREHVRTAVAADSWPAGRASFWYGGSDVDWTRLRMTVLARDIVGVSVPFATGQTAGSFGAVLMWRDGVWRFHCSATSFPQRELESGCPPVRKREAVSGAG